VKVLIAHDRALLLLLYQCHSMCNLLLLLRLSDDNVVKVLIKEGTIHLD
jgi:hypothetical protein